MGLELGFGVGTVVLLGAIAYGISQYQNRNPANEKRTEDATREIYRTTER